MQELLGCCCSVEFICEFIILLLRCFGDFVVTKIPKKCSLVGCKSNYESERKKMALEGNSTHVPVFRFPSEKVDPENRERWLKAVSSIKLNLEVNSETVLCERH